MEPIYIALIAAGSLSFVFLLCVLVGLYLVGSRRRHGGIEKFLGVKFAHRGLHDATRAENSLSAFAAAKAAGFGIELDVHISRDGELVVFHDFDLSRVCGVCGSVRDYTARELGEMRLGDTEDTIPTLRSVLELIDGAVPLLIEMKSANGKDGVAERLVEELRDYRGEFIVESFNPVALRRVRRARPDISLGMLSMEYMKEERFRGKLLYLLLENLCLNFLVRPDFIAYDKSGYKKKVVRHLRRSFGTPLIAWTVCSEEEERAAVSHGFDTVIFENYIPEK